MMLGSLEVQVTGSIPRTTKAMSVTQLLDPRGQDPGILEPAVLQRGPQKAHYGLIKEYSSN